MTTLFIKDFLTYSLGLLSMSEILRSPVITIFFVVIAGSFFVYLGFGLGFCMENV